MSVEWGNDGETKRRQQTHEVFIVTQIVTVIRVIIIIHVRVATTALLQPFDEQRCTGMALNDEKGQTRLKRVVSKCCRDLQIIKNQLHRR